jgi:tetratricopeptide (TPR) repeat protein
VKALRALAVTLLAAALVPELQRYAAERALRQASAILHAGTAVPVAQRAAAFEEVGERLSRLAAQRPADHRPIFLAGSAHLLAGRPEPARQAYARALAREERAEIVLNLGRAYALLDQRPQALAAFVRCTWINPQMLHQLPAAARDLVAQEIARREQALAQGTLPSPPPLP